MFFDKAFELFLIWDVWLMANDGNSIAFNYPLDARLPIAMLFSLILAGMSQW